MLHLIQNARGDDLSSRNLRQADWAVRIRRGCRMRRQPLGAGCATAGLEPDLLLRAGMRRVFSLRGAWGPATVSSLRSVLRGALNSNRMNPATISIIGAGTMGANIALDFATHGFSVRLTDTRASQLDLAREMVATNVRLLEQEGLLTSRAIRPDSISYVADLDEAVRDAVLILEAVSEDLPLKQRIFAELEKKCPPDIIFASNTSTFIPSALAAGLQHPERVVVMHYWNPAHLIPLVEVVPHAGTLPAVLARVKELLEACGKRPVVLTSEVAGFIGNRLAFALQREAMELVARGVATPEAIDDVVRLGFGRRIPVSGVFGTADLGGLDVYRAVCGSVFPDLCNDQGVPDALARLVEQGRLGVKTGAGWSTYTERQAQELRLAVAKELIRHARIDQEKRSNGAGT